MLPEDHKIPTNMAFLVHHIQSHALELRKVVLLNMRVYGSIYSAMMVDYAVKKMQTTPSV